MVPTLLEPAATDEGTASEGYRVVREVVEDVIDELLRQFRDSRLSHRRPHQLWVSHEDTLRPGRQSSLLSVDRCCTGVPCLTSHRRKHQLRPNCLSSTRRVFKAVASWRGWVKEAWWTRWRNARSVEAHGEEGEGRLVFGNVFSLKYYTDFSNGLVPRSGPIHELYCYRTPSN